MIRLPTNRSPARTALAGAWATLLLTAAHHVYGGIVYRTPWRLHGAAVALAVGAALHALVSTGERAASDRVRGAARRAVAALVLLVPVLSVGAFEGAYNHVLKNVLYFGGASRDLLVRLFPPPMYELPDDAAFEISGCAQVLTAAWTAVGWGRYVRALAARPEHTTAGGAAVGPLAAVVPEDALRR
jgi:hypothetical protein